MRIARTVLVDVARRWDAALPDERPSLMSDIQLAKVCVTNAAVDATDEALRIAGGPGFWSDRSSAPSATHASLINPPLDDIAYQGFAYAVIDRERAGR